MGWPGQGYKAGERQAGLEGGPALGLVGQCGGRWVPEAPQTGETQRHTSGAVYRRPSLSVLAYWQRCVGRESRN